MQKQIIRPNMDKMCMNTTKLIFKTHKASPSKGQTLPTKSIVQQSSSMTFVLRVHPLKNKKF
jgi:hypothetical protein